MKVHELITILQTFDQEALVNRWEYNPDGPDWIYIYKVEQDTSGVWDHDNNVPVYEVFIQ